MQPELGRFTPEDERGYLEEQYSEELKGAAQRKGLQVFDRDGRLIAHPSVIRVMPGDRAVENQPAADVYNPPQ